MESALLVPDRCAITREVIMATLTAESCIYPCRTQLDGPKKMLTKQKKREVVDQSFSPIHRYIISTDLFSKQIIILEKNKKTKKTFNVGMSCQRELHPIPFMFKQLPSLRAPRLCEPRRISHYVKLNRFRCLLLTPKLPCSHIGMMDVFIDVSNKCNQINGSPSRHHEK